MNYEGLGLIKRFKFVFFLALKWLFEERAVQEPLLAGPRAL